MDAFAPLQGYGRAWRPVTANGDCFYNAFNQTFFPAGTFEEGTGVEWLRNELAQALKDLRERAAREPDNQEVQAWWRVLRGTAVEYLGREPDWAGIEQLIRTPRSWDNVGGELAPFLAAFWFGVNIDIVSPTGGYRLYIPPASDSEERPVVVLYRPSRPEGLSHWDATADFSFAGD